MKEGSQFFEGPLSDTGGRRKRAITGLADLGLLNVKKEPRTEVDEEKESVHGSLRGNKGRGLPLGHMIKGRQGGKSYRKICQKKKKERDHKSSTSCLRR